MIGSWPSRLPRSLIECFSLLCVSSASKDRYKKPVSHQAIARSSAQPLHLAWCASETLCLSEYLLTSCVLAGDGPAAHHTILGDSFLRSGRPIKTRFVEKSQKVPRTPKTPAKTPGMPKTYTSGDQTFTMPPCTLEGVHSSQLGHGRISVKTAFSGATLFITGGSGYVGSVVLEQLLRFCPDVAKIYLLIRGKRGNTGGAAGPCKDASVLEQQAASYLHRKPLPKPARLSQACRTVYFTKYA